MDVEMPTSAPKPYRNPSANLQGFLKHAYMSTHAYACLREGQEGEGDRQADRQAGRQAGRQTERHEHEGADRKRQTERHRQQSDLLDTFQ